MKTIPNLKSLYIKVNDQDRIHSMLQVLSSLQFLNGIPVEHEQMFNDSFGSDTEPIDETIENQDIEHEDDQVKETIIDFLEKVL